MKDRQPNRLEKSTSPYLLQHAYNPVDWYPWGEEALLKAREEDKPILVSIGYSSCHWCHVMERESFENDSIAAYMNEHFINIKIDREERPDLDQVYMEAVQAMGLNGGWPLNVFLTPDQRPFYGGTYFPPENWMKMLGAIHKAFSEKRGEVEKSAGDLVQHLSSSELEKFGLVVDASPFTLDFLKGVYEKFSSGFDPSLGGMNKAPKFPMPSNWQFLARYYQITQDQLALDHLELTLDKMALGGIYDQAGGGFARYSVDKEWFAPHFEKMMYDNGQLMELYAEAYKITGKPLYKHVLYQTLEWLEREMTGKGGGFYSALDADSEGVEGKFYTWTIEEAETLLDEEELAFAKKYYHVNFQGNWEDSRNILYLDETPEALAAKEARDVQTFINLRNRVNQKLLAEREQRVKPGLDDKILSGWNAMMISGLTRAFEATQDEVFLIPAIKNAEFLIKKMMKKGVLYRSFKAGDLSGEAYLEDYSFLMKAFLDLYEVTFDEKWIERATELMIFTQQHFYDESDGFFFYTSNQAEKLIIRRKEFFDNVVPASNSQMALNLHRLGVLLDNDDYKLQSRNMLQKMTQKMGDFPVDLTHWGILYMELLNPTAEVVIIGPEADTFRTELSKKFLPNMILMGAKKESNLPLMENKIAAGGQTTIYVCYNKTCKLPVQTVNEALKQIK